jgi:hypothetical protein
MIVGSACQGKGSFPVRRYLMEGLSSLIPVYRILHILNYFLPGGALSPGGVMMLFSRAP